MSTPARTFEVKPAVRQSVPLLLGLAGASSSGKTYSALRLATGVQSVVGGKIVFIDTEHRRALHYADKFKFEHVDFTPPWSPLDYLSAIEAAVKAGAGVIVVDSMSHEHHWVMDEIEAFLDQRAGDSEEKRQKLMMLANVKPKNARKKLNRAIVQLGVNAILCYRAADKVKPIKGQGVKHVGWTPETTSPLVYDMVQRFLLLPGSDGKPTLQPETPDEQAMVKNPEQFRGWFTPGVQLSEDIGRRLAEWARGGPVAPKQPPAQAAAQAAATEKPAPARPPRQPAEPPPPSESPPTNDKVLAAGRKAAKEKGTEGLVAWWQGLKAGEKFKYKPNLENELKAAAKVYDDAHPLPPPVTGKPTPAPAPEYEKGDADESGLKATDGLFPPGSEPAGQPDATRDRL